mmetsp:Transcript_30396/g.83745  ORF Transcript_30396/g.83745 Transcript_30396/m.83745 type:complete len:207 (-) Transcript_30396:697-1317(-)
MCGVGPDPDNEQGSVGGQMRSNRDVQSGSRLLLREPREGARKVRPRAGHLASRAVLDRRGGGALRHARLRPGPASARGHSGEHDGGHRLWDGQDPHQPAGLLAPWLAWRGHGAHGAVRPFLLYSAAGLRAGPAGVVHEEMAPGGDGRRQRLPAGRHRQQDSEGVDTGARCRVLGPRQNRKLGPALGAAGCPRSRCPGADDCHRRCV